MQKWELYSMSCELGWGANIGDLWSKKDKQTGKTQWDRLKDLASSGWELVDATPITLGGTTTGILYTFKRPVEQIEKQSFPGDRRGVGHGADDAGYLIIVQICESIFEINGA